MRFHVGESVNPVEQYPAFAQGVESLGYDGFAVSDSILFARESATSYLYSEDGSRDFIEKKPVVESFVLATAIGVSTSLEITTSVVKLPMRHPVYAAKLASSVSAMVRGGFNFGVGLSPWPEDYAALGVPYAGRGRRLDECIDIVKGLTAGGYFEYHGEFYDFPAIKINPVPSRPLPIIVGGHSDGALKRAARNDGWSCAGSKLEDLVGMVKKLTAFRADSAQTGDFRIFQSDMGEVTYDDVRRKEDAGVTDLILYFRNIYASAENLEPISAKLDRFKKFSDEVMGRISERA